MYDSIKMTKKGNLLLDGVKYHAVRAPDCVGCVMRLAPDCAAALCTIGARSGQPLYEVRGEVIFVRRNKEKQDASSGE